MNTNFTMNVTLDSDLIIEVSDNFDATLEKNRELENELNSLRAENSEMKEYIKCLERENDILIKLKILHHLIITACSCEKNEITSILYREATKSNDQFWEQREYHFKIEEDIGKFLKFCYKY